MTESKELLSPIPNFQSSSHDVRSSVSGIAMIGTIFSPIPSSVARRDRQDDNGDYTPQQSIRGMSESPILQSRIFDNVELDSEPKRSVETVIVVETVDEESVGSIDFERMRFSLVTENIQSQNYSYSPQQSPLAASEYVKLNTLSDQPVVLEYPDVEERHSGSKESSRSIKDGMSPRTEDKNLFDPVDVDRLGVTRNMEGAPSSVDKDCVQVKCMIVTDNVCNKIETTSDVHDKWSNSVDEIRSEWEIASNEQPSHTDAVQLNDSFASTGSNREEEIQQAQDALGATSMAFMDRLRGASLRRKMNLARSRDSLVNKERAQREAIAASEAAKSSEESHSEGSNYQGDSKDRSDNCQFKARPLSKATLKSGGMSGVRFVEKRPVTTPCSPLLGARRQSMEPTTIAKDVSCPDEPCLFKALPWPRNKVENAGTYGVPKVEKRPTTVPESPLLGHRRRKGESSSSREKKAPVRPSFKGPPLISKRFDPCIASGSKEKENDFRPNRATTFPKDAFVPSSTQRATQRAAYDLQRHEREQTRRIRKRRESLAQIKVLREELKGLLSKM